MSLLALAFLLASWRSPPACPRRPVDDALAHFAAGQVPRDREGHRRARRQRRADRARPCSTRWPTAGCSSIRGTKQVYYMDAAGALVDAETGAKADGRDADGLKKVRLNNGVRSKLAAVGGTLDLAVAGPGKRLRRRQRGLRARTMPKALAAVEAALGQGDRPGRQGRRCSRPAPPSWRPCPTRPSRTSASTRSTVLKRAATRTRSAC